MCEAAATAKRHPTHGPRGVLEPAGAIPNNSPSCRRGCQTVWPRQILSPRSKGGWQGLRIIPDGTVMRMGYSSDPQATLRSVRPTAHPSSGGSLGVSFPESVFTPISRLLRQPRARLLQPSLSFTAAAAARLMVSDQFWSVACGFPKSWISNALRLALGES